MEDVKAILIAGPTASGKSALALDLAERHDGVIFNADSMQVYDGLRILTARPTDADVARIPHRLYGHVDPLVPYSVGAYLRDAEPVLAEIAASGRLPIVVGGTGLYFKALLGHLDDMPAVDDAVRRRWRRRLEAEGPHVLHAILSDRDPVAARRIRPGDGQRIVRALEVGESFGGPLSSLQTGRAPKLLDITSCLAIVIAPERELLRRRIAERFHCMLNMGALEEVSAFRQRCGAEATNVVHAIGLRELCAVLDGELALSEASQRAVTRSRQYAKRQETWFRNQFGTEWKRLPAAEIRLLGRYRAS